MAFNEDVSFIEYNVVQPTQDFVTNFDTIGGTTDVVLITVDGVLTDIPESSYTAQQINHTTWRVTPEVPSDSVVRLYRVTDLDQMMYVFTAGAKFIARNMDSNFKQIRHAQQEVRDNFSKLKADIGFTNLEDTVRAVNAVYEASVVVKDSAQDAANAAASQATLAQDYAIEAEAYNLDAQQAAITATAVESNVYTALTEQQTEVLNALSNLSTAANKFYPTLADANADIANIQVGQPVTIGEAENGGLWYKATAEAISLTKSPYDPVEQAKADATTKANAAEANATAKVNTLNTNIQDNRKYAKTLIPNVNYFRNFDGALLNDNTFAYSDYVAVKAGDVIKVYVYARDNRPVVVWCDPTKTTFSRLDSISSSSTVEYKTEEVIVLADGFITVNSSNRTANDIYFYAYSDEKLFLRPESLNSPSGVQGYDQAQKMFKDIVENRKSLKTLIPNINYYRKSDGTLVNSNASAYSDYIAVKAGDAIELNTYVQFNNPVVVWCDPTKTTFSRLDAISSTSTATLTTSSVSVIQDGFITVNTQNRSASDNYFYAYYDEKLFLRPESLNAPSGVQGYDQAQKMFNDIAENRTKEVLPYSSPKLVWSLGNGTDLNNDSGNAFRHTQFIRVKAGDLIEASLIRMSNSTGGFLDIFVGNDRVNRSERVPVTNIDAVTRVGTLKKEIAQDGWVAFSTAYTGYDMSLVNITVYNKALYLPADRKTTEITVFGDSLSQGMGNAANLAIDVAPWTYKLNRNGVGGENIFDTSMRSGAVPLWIKGGFTIPASSSEYVNIDARWLFNEQHSIDVSGNPVVDARNNTSFASAVFATIDGKQVRLDKASSDSFGRAQWRVRFNATQTESYTVNDHKIVFADSASQKTGIGMMMMGTNGGMFDYGQNINDRAFTRKQLDEIIMLFQRNARLFEDQKLIVWGYHGVFTNAISDEYGVATTSRKYFRAACQKAFGEKFIDMYGYLVGKGLSDLKVELNSDEVSFIQTHDGVTSGSGGNSFLPLWSGDNTHPRAIVYQAMMNAAFDRMYKLGWIEDRLQIPLNFISDLVATPAASAISVGATTTATATYTNPANSSDIFEWTSSSPTVATVSNNSWVNNWTSSARKTTTITGVSAGTATITCKCRFGGATASFDITVA